MTEKELRKLNRLEMLELLLSQTKENEALKEEMERYRQSGAAVASDNALENIARASEQLNSALSLADRMTRQLKNVSSPTDTSVEADSAEKQNYPKAPISQESQQAGSDRNLFWRIMNYFSKNPAAMSELPVEIQKDIINRLKVIKNAK